MKHKGTNWIPVYKHERLAARSKLTMSLMKRKFLSYSDRGKGAGGGWGYREIYDESNDTKAPKLIKMKGSELHIDKVSHKK